MVPRRYSPALPALPALLAVLAACAQHPASTAPRPLVPKNGPEASVRVEYEGGIFHRRLNALFSVKRPAFVMVAHLGGDGMVRVLFPEDARESGWVPGGRVFRTEITSGDYDAAPGYWFMRPAFFRSPGARTASYDGNGHGFVFVIASSVPLRFDRVSEYGLWNDVELSGYASAPDPRALVRQYADLVASKDRYTLDYASSFTSWGTYSYAHAAMDCAMLSSRHGFVPWHYTGFALGFASSFGPGKLGCSSYDSWDYQRYGRRGVVWFAAQPIPPVASPAPSEPIARPKPIAPRPGRRDPLAPTPRGLGGPTLSFSPTDINRRFDSDRRATPSGGERVYRAPSTWHRGPYSGWNSEAGQRTPRQHLPRPSEPRTAPTGSSGPGETSRPAPSPSASGASGGSGSSGETRADPRPSASEPKSREP